MASLDEFDSSLEEVAMLTSFSLFGEAHVIPVALSGEDHKRLDF